MIRLRKFLIAGQVAIRASLAAGLAVAIARLLNLETPIFALIAAVIVTDLDPAETRKLAVRRIVSTGIGALCGVAFAHFLGASSWEAALTVLVAMLASAAVTKLGDPKLAGYLAALIVMNYQADPLHYAFLRFIETALGIVVAWAVSLVPKLIHIEDIEDDKKA